MCAARPPESRCGDPQGHEPNFPQGHCKADADDQGEGYQDEDGDRGRPSAKTWTSVSPENGLNFGTSSLPGVPVVSVLPRLAPNYKFGLASTTPIVFGESTASPEIEKLEPTELETTKLEVTESESPKLEVSESTSLNAVANQSTATIITTAESSESDDITTDTDASLASDEEWVSTDNDSTPDTIQEKIFEPLAVTIENVSSFKTGTALVLAVAGEKLYAQSRVDVIHDKVTEPSMALTQYHGTPSDSSETALEAIQVCLTTKAPDAFVPALPLASRGSLFALQAAFDIHMIDRPLRLAAYLMLPPQLQTGDASIDTPSKDELRVTLFTPPETTRPFCGRLINIQIGIVMLGESLRATTNRLANSFTVLELIDAFLHIANYEIEALDLGQVHRVNAVAVRNYKYLQNRVIIGSIKLSDFLALISFDVNGVALAHSVIEVWKLCAERDEDADVFNTKREASVSGELSDQDGLALWSSPCRSCEWDL